MKGKHFLTEQDGSVLCIGWDAPGRVNTLDGEAGEELLAILKEADTDASILGYILFSLKKDTGLGASIPLIYGMQKEEEAREMLGRMHEVFLAIKKLAEKKPCVMIIDGLCLGGVYELALLFPWLIATDNPATAIGVPEGKLGIIQGLGFLKRAVPRIGLSNTILLATTGKNIYARPAEKMGLVDEVVANVHSDMRTMETVMRENAARIAKERIFRLAAGLSIENGVDFAERAKRAFQGLPVVRHFIFWKARRDVMKFSRGHYPAPLAMIDVLRKGWRKTERQACLLVELPIFAKLAVSPLAKRLMRVFFAREQAKKFMLPGGMKFSPAEDRMAVIGGGAMGGQIAFLLAKKGFAVTLIDINRERLAKTMTEILKKVGNDKSLKPHRKNAVISKIRMTDSYVSLVNICCFIDATTESLKVKKDVLRSCQSIAPDAFVFFNTSTIPIGMIAEGAICPEKVGLLHFFNPVDKQEPVEIGGGPLTSPETTATACKLSKILGKIPFVVKDEWGFLVNRVLMRGMQAAVSLLLGGHSIREIDEAMKQYGFALDSGHAMGPFELADFVGIKTAADVAGFLGNLPSFEKKFSDVLEGMAAEGMTFWVRKGKRFAENPKVYFFLKKKYNWRGEILHAKYPAEIILWILHAMRNEASDCLAENVIDNEKNLDLLMLLATGIPPAFRGGLLEEMRETRTHIVSF
jgi:3-hydroxyacyl-CoA dehydrogenase/enoyl-CoA hydratase/carnithine racemase